MKRFFASLMALVCAASLGFSANIALAGGWGVTTLDDLPKDVVAGQEIKVGLTIRQHGVTPMKDAQPTMLLTNPQTGKSFSVTAKPQGQTGHYVATIKFPSAGQWHWRMTSFPEQTLPTLTVLNKAPKTASAASKTTAEKQNVQSALGVWGKELFVAKGCFMCHSHSSVAGSGRFSGAYGATGAPNLTNRPLTDDYLRMWLKDPKSVKPQTNMPNLQLKEGEIDALVAFLSVKATR